MKRVLCPKCENYLYFDETKYSEGQSLVFECEHCGKQFSIRLGKSKVKALRKEENLEEEAEVHKEEFGYITVIENVFGFKQILPLQEGDNVIGRRCVGTVINTPIESGDMSMSSKDAANEAERLKPVALRRYGTVEEMADVVLFLASPMSSYMTGETVTANGGKLAIQNPWKGWESK